MPRPISLVLLCAGEIGLRCMRHVLQSNVARLLAVFSYQLDPPEQEALLRIEELARQHDVRIFEAANVGKPAYRDLWEHLQCDYILAVKWRMMVPSWVIDSSHHGLLIFHASL